MKRLSIIVLLLSAVVFFTATQMKASDTTTQSEEVKLEEQLAALHVKLENVSTQKEYDAVILEVKQILSNQAQGTTYNCGVTCYIEYFRCLSQCNNTRACQGYCNLSLEQCNRACE